MSGSSRVQGMHVSFHHNTNLFCLLCIKAYKRFTMKFVYISTHSCNIECGYYTVTCMWSTHACTIHCLCHNCTLFGTSNYLCSTTCGAHLSLPNMVVEEYPVYNRSYVSSTFLSIGDAYCSFQWCHPSQVTQARIKSYKLFDLNESKSLPRLTCMYAWADLARWGVHTV